MEISNDLNQIVKTIKSKETPISQKMNCLFHLRNLKTPEASLCIQQCLSGDSVLLDHEVAYVLGQLKEANSIEFLFRIADDASINPIVRHEAIEALGNFESQDESQIANRIANQENQIASRIANQEENQEENQIKNQIKNQNLIKRLKIFLTNSNAIIKESALLAIYKLTNCKEEISIFGTRDPAEPFEGDFDTAIKMFMKGDLVEKYRAMFYFRNKNDKASVNILLKGFDDTSDLLRHEVAFILGQMENPEAVDGLIKVLENVEERDIVRHEAAEALGNIGNRKGLDVLKKYLKSEIKILRESAEVGLGIAELY